MRRFGMALFFVLAALGAGQVLAHEGHEHKVMGTVAAVDAKHLEVTTKDEKKMTISLNSETRFVRGKSPATLGDVKVGERVVVSMMEKQGTMIAREVMLAASGK